ncbi:hypothetical protein DESUT3_17200 [Desulfuromonas versatilis]|uniref:Pilus assembly protein PilX n=1 Tax=Desulfuromonas versatilis TaxID=2802975 RepID=A0ABM8HVV0_9BACT|nr:PilX N-terminal domain-containing pilus assembly protein [Desulfuromonas versatilis]BCR04651.1 hypothetical protein DESUT3_17200 [Desulfuromonas versatilis]
MPDIARKIVGDQRGAVLVTGLVLMLVLTLLGLAAMQSTTLQEKMAGNLSNRNVAFQAAEAALREGETFLGGATLPAFDGNGGLYQPAVNVFGLGWDAADSRPYSGVLGGVAAQPRYIVEELGPLESSSMSLTAGTAVSEDTLYRVTARGVGGAGAAEVILQSTYLR